MSDTETLYDRTFFDDQSAASLRSARIVLPELLRFVRPESMIDVGCGVGTWLSAAAELGVGEGLGIDGDYVDRDALMIPPERFLAADLSQPGLADVVAAHRPGRFDLVVCLEVAEHLPFDRSFSLIDDLCSLGDLVLFSAAVPVQLGIGHINEQWPEFWAMQFRARGHACFDLVRPEIWGKPGIEWWYAQNTLVFARQGSAAYTALPPDAAADTKPIARVHPAAWLSRTLIPSQSAHVPANDAQFLDYRDLVASWVAGEDLNVCPQTPERTPDMAGDAGGALPHTPPGTAEPDGLPVGTKASSEATGTNPSAAHGQSSGSLDGAPLAETTTNQFALVRQQLAAQRGAIAATADEAALLRSKLADLDRHAATLQAANVTLRNLLTRRDLQLTEAHYRTDALEGLRTAHDEALHALQVLRTQMTGELTAAVREIEALRRSTSWRVTAPLRALMKVVLRRGG